MQFANMARVVAASALLAGGIMPVSSAVAQDGKTITGAFDTGPGGFPKKFNPLAATGGFTWFSVYFEPLVTYSADLSVIEGALADSFEVSEDQKTYTFHLAEETWHDGQAFGAEDVKFTLELAQNPDSGSVFVSRLADVESIEVVDDRTVKLILSRPNSALLADLTQLMIMPKHALGAIAPAEVASTTWWSTTPIGTGPFKFDEYVTDQYVVLSADEDYRAGTPKVDRIVNRYFENPAAAVAALRSGEIQFTYVEPDDVATLRDSDGIRVIEGNSYVVNYVGFNQKVDLWKDVRVREAFLYAIDREAIVASLYGGAATVAQCGYVAPHLVPEGITEYSYDPEKARALLNEAGWADINGDDPITWLTYYNSPQAANVMAAVQAMVGQVGINLVPRVVDVPTYNGIVYGNDDAGWDEFPLIYAGLRNGPNPASLNIGLNGSQLPPNGANIMRIEFDSLTASLDAAMGETDSAVAEEKWQQVCSEMNQLLPWAPMWVSSRYGAASERLVDFVWTPAPAGGPYAAHAENWDITAD